MGDFLQFNPELTNALNDADYLNSAYRLNGAVAGIAPANVHNKLLYQASTMVKALADMMVGKGYTISDASLANLIAALSKITTEADLLALISTVGSIPIRGASGLSALAAAAAGNYLKSAGVGALPVWGKLALVSTGIKIGRFNRTGAGNEVVTGVGFNPSVVIFLSQLRSTNMNLGVGFDDGTTAMSAGIFTISNNTVVDSFLSATYSAYCNQGYDYLRGYISAKGADGFTVTFSLGGSALPASTTFFYLALP